MNRVKSSKSSPPTLFLIVGKNQTQKATIQPATPRRDDDLFLKAYFNFIKNRDDKAKPATLKLVRNAAAKTRLSPFAAAMARRVFVAFKDAIGDEPAFKTIKKNLQRASKTFHFKVIPEPNAANNPNAIRDVLIVLCDKNGDVVFSFQQDPFGTTTFVNGKPYDKRDKTDLKNAILDALNALQ